MVLHINPPPSDKCCEKCHKHISELKPFGGPGDPLVGDFTGRLLLKNFRAMHPRIKEYDDKVAAIKDWDEFFKTNPEEAENLSFYDQLVSTVSASWECRDCFIREE
jgi:hypothetical protein